MEHGYCLSESDIEEVDNLVKGNSNLQELLNIIKSSFVQYTRSLIPFNPNSKFLITTEPTKAILENTRVNNTINVPNRKDSVLIDNVAYCPNEITKCDDKQLIDNVLVDNVNDKISDKKSLGLFENKQPMNNNAVVYPDKKIN